MLDHRHDAHPRQPHEAQYVLLHGPERDTIDPHTGDDYATWYAVVYDACDHQLLQRTCHSYTHVETIGQELATKYGGIDVLNNAMPA